MPCGDADRSVVAPVLRQAYSPLKKNPTPTAGFYKLVEGLAERPHNSGGINAPLAPGRRCRCRFDALKRASRRWGGHVVNFSLELRRILQSTDLKSRPSGPCGLIDRRTASPSPPPESLIPNAQGTLVPVTCCSPTFLVMAGKLRLDPTSPRFARRSRVPVSGRSSRSL